MIPIAIATRAFRATRGLIALPALLLALIGPAAAQVPHYTFFGPDDAGEYGVDIDGAGDVDGDGHDDIIVGARLNLARVLSGRDGSVLLEITGQPGDAALGTAVAGAGRVDGDGLADLLVGDPSSANLARIYSGATGAILKEFVGDAPFDNFGAALAGLGDVNDDGRADVLVGAPGGNYVRAFCGRSGDELYTVTGNGPNDMFGKALDDVGDFDGDGVPDAIVGTLMGDYCKVLAGDTGDILATFTGENSFGQSVAGAGDVNRDGHMDVIVVTGSSMGSARVFSGKDNSLLHEFDLAALDSAEGGGDYRPTVSGVGDLDGDFFDDVLIGLPTAAGFDGVVYAFSGKQGQLLGSIAGLPTPEPGFGRDLAAAGDTNADGFPEVVVGHVQAANARGIVRVFGVGISPWADLPGGGTGRPLLWGSGSLQVGTVVTWDMLGDSGQVGFLIISTTYLGVPFEGGILVPAPELLIPAAMSPVAGAAQQRFTWPPGVPSGLQLFAQLWLADVSAPSGWAPSNGVQATVP